MTTALQLKLNLLESRPAVWRRILVPEDYSFFDLHVAIQDAFGWEDCHLHQFFTQNPYGRRRDFQCITFPLPEMEGEIIDERKVKLSDFFKKPKDKMLYEYDFGDSWMHEIKLEKILPGGGTKKYPRLLGGEMACPPEDCGGIGGYYHLLEILANPKDEEHCDMLEWLGIKNPADFDPAAFSAAAVKFRDPKKVLRQWQKHMPRT